LTLYQFGIIGEELKFVVMGLGQDWYSIPASTSAREYLFGSKITRQLYSFNRLLTKPHSYALTYPRTVEWTIRETLRFKKKTVGIWSAERIPWAT
jgi:hypothetical protein